MRAGGTALRWIAAAAVVAAVAGLTAAALGARAGGGAGAEAPRATVLAVGADDLLGPAGTGGGGGTEGAGRISPTMETPQGVDGPPYDGRFTFLRVRFGPDGGRGLRGGFFGRGRGREPEWAHDMPRAETNFARILEATTTLDPYMEGSRVLELDDPEIFKYPVLYIVEVGYWDPSSSEVEALRSFLLKGGFLIVDDFRGDWELRNFVGHMERVLPDRRPMRVPDDHAIFDSFFHIENPTEVLPPPTFRQYVPVYVGYFEGDDPAGRIMVMANFNNDHGDFWEWSDRGYYPIDLSNEAYKFGVNYIVYAMTH